MGKICTPKKKVSRKVKKDNLIINLNSTVLTRKLLILDFTIKTLLSRPYIEVSILQKIKFAKKLASKLKSKLLKQLPFNKQKSIIVIIIIIIMKISDFKTRVDGAL